MPEAENCNWLERYEVTINVDEGCNIVLPHSLGRKSWHISYASSWQNSPMGKRLPLPTCSNIGHFLCQYDAPHPTCQEPPPQPLLWQFLKAEATKQTGYVATNFQAQKCGNGFTDRNAPLAKPGQLHMVMCSIANATICHRYSKCHHLGEFFTEPCIEVNNTQWYVCKGNLQRWSHKQSKPVKGWAWGKHEMCQDEISRPTLITHQHTHTQHTTSRMTCLSLRVTAIGIAQTQEDIYEEMSRSDD
jgi:hypothetical protein